MNRTLWQQLAEDRILDAEALLVAQRWSAAYYLTGYAVECGLKACIIGRVAATPEVIFLDKKFSERCWSHKFDSLVKLADLEAQLAAASTANAEFNTNWLLLRGWQEHSRYEQWTETEAQAIFDAVNDKLDGVLPWVRAHW